MKRVVPFLLPIVAALTALAACATAPESSSARTDVRAVHGADEVRAARIPLAEFVRRCRDAGGSSFTYDQATAAALEARTVLWLGPDVVDAAESARLFHAVMSAAGFECDRVGPADLAVVRISAPK